MDNTAEAVVYNDKALAQDPRHIHAHVNETTRSERHAEKLLRD